jgi:hypothetical protein
LIYLISNKVRGLVHDMDCLDTLGRYLLYAFVVDFALEGLDVIQRTYAAEESFDILYALVHGRLFETHIIFQILLGTVTPILLLGIVQVASISKPARIAIYSFSSMAALIGIFFMRWNVVIGGQLFSKSFRGFTIYKLALIGQEGLLIPVALALLPVALLLFFIWFLPPWQNGRGHETAAAVQDGHATTLASN